MNKNHCLIGCELLAAISLISIVVGIVLLSLGPEGGVRLPNEMEDYAIEYLNSHEVLNDSETLLAYYDITISLKGTEAVILTSKRLIYHKKGEDTAIPLSDIKEIRHRKETMVGDVFEVEPKSGATMKFDIALLNNAETFKNVLFSEWEKVKKSPAILKANSPN